MDESKFEPNETALVTPVILPVCPYCGDDPAKLTIMNQLFPGGMIGAIMFCGNPVCRKIISTQIVGMAAQQQQAPARLGPQLVTKEPEVV